MTFSNMTTVKYGLLLLTLLLFTPMRGESRPISHQFDTLGVIGSTSLEATLLLDSMIAHRQSNALAVKQYEVNRYERLSVGWLNLTEREKNRLLLRYLKDLFRYTDTSDITGEPIDYLVTREKMEAIAHAPDSQDRVVVQAINLDWVDQLLSEQGIKMLTDEAFSGFSIYDTEVRILLQSIPGPLSAAAKRLHNYRLSPELVQVEGELCHLLEFTPINPIALGFRGRLFVTTDGSYAVRRAALELQGHRNVNFLDRLFVQQEYARDEQGRWRLERDISSFEVAFLKLAVRRSHIYSDYSFDRLTPEQFAKRPIYTLSKGAFTHGEEYWVEHRTEPMSDRELAVKEEIARKMAGTEGNPWAWFVGSLIDGRFSFGKWDISPIFSILTFNDLEGYRLRLGGSTRQSLHPNLYLEGYGAYGFNDQKWKYFGEASWNFDKSVSHPMDFPIHAVKLSVKDDLSFPGQELAMGSKDNLFYSFRRYPIEQMLRVRSLRLSYHREHRTGFGYEFWANTREDSPIGKLAFELPNPDGSTTSLSSLRATELGFRLRYAPGERFLQRRYGRFYTTRNTPIFTLSHRSGIKGLLGGDYHYNLTEFSHYQRIRASGFGFFDLLLKAGKQWNEVPFPYLVTPQANPSYVQVDETYDLMGISEFLADQYVSWQVEYHAGGLLFNLLPINRYLKLREVFAFKGFAGSLSDKNDPNRNPRQMLLPQQLSGMPSANAIGNTPYMEASVGIDNIFRFLRVDYVWRLSYLDRPGIDRHGLRIGMKLQF